MAVLDYAGLRRYDGKIKQYTGDLVDTVVEVTDTQPVDLYNKIWIETSEEDVELAEMSDVDNLKSAFNNHDMVIDGVNGLLPLAIPYVISSTGNWTTANFRHLLLPFAPGDTVVITAAETFPATFALLKSDEVVGSSPAPFCTDYPERIVVNAGETSTSVTAPSDCNYLYVTAINTSGNVIPQSILINGVERTYNIRKKIDDVSREAASADAEIANVKKEVVSMRSISGDLDIWGLRSALNGEFSRVPLPSFDYLSGIDINLFSDGYKFICDADLTKNKNESTNTVTVSTTAGLATALENATSGDTIYLSEGVYTPIEITKSINLIGTGEVIFARQTTGGFNTTGSSVVFSSKNTVSLPDVVYDATMRDKGIYLPLKKVGSASTVISTEGSWCYSSSKVYVHLVGGKRPSEADILLSDGTDAVIKTGTVTEDVTLYLENILVFGGKYNLRLVADTTYTNQKVVAVDCKFVCAYNNNNVSLYGVDGFFQRCGSFFAFRDGFNYHADTTNNILSNGLEIDCIGHDNGARETGLASPSNNGSTIHDGGKIVRINGLYYNNNGGNVADTSPGTESYNYGCVAFDSIAPQDDGNESETSADFWVQSLAQMYLFGCRAIGNSKFNLRTPTAGTSRIFVDKCEYTRTTGHIVVAQMEIEVNEVAILPTSLTGPLTLTSSDTSVADAYIAAPDAPRGDIIGVGVGYCYITLTDANNVSEMFYVHVVEST